MAPYPSESLGARINNAANAYPQAEEKARAIISNPYLSQQTCVAPSQPSVIDCATRLEVSASALRDRLSSLHESLLCGPANGAIAGMTQPQPPRGLGARLQTALDALETAHNHLRAISEHLGLEV